MRDPEISRYALTRSDGEIRRYRFMAQPTRTREAVFIAGHVVIGRTPGQPD